MSSSTAAATPETALLELRKAIERHDPTLAGPTAGLPMPTTRFVGRERDLREALELLVRQLALAVRGLVEAGDVCARAILEKRRSDLDAGAELLIARETLTAEDFEPLRPVAARQIEKATV